MKIQITDFGSTPEFATFQEIGIDYKNGKVKVVDKKRFMIAIIQHGIKYKKAAKLKRANRMSKKKKTHTWLDYKI